MTTGQRAALRAMANGIETILHVGKEGVGPNLCKQAWDALEARELVKGTVQTNAPIDAREACRQICEQVHAEPVQVIGRKFVMYKPSRENPRIKLEEL